MELQELLGKNIAARRKLLGLRQKELAARLNITQDALTRIEKGKTAPRMKRIALIADILGCSVSLLFHSENDDLNERALAIVEILRTLPEDGQKALVQLVSDAARVMNRYTR